MTDKELLELAARAYGFGAQNKPDNCFCWTESEYPRGSGLHGALWNYHGYMDSAELFNSLTSDADTFRLAVALRFRVECDNNGQAYVWKDGVLLWNEFALHVDVEAERRAATRRAITRAAAAIAQERGGNDRNEPTGKAQL